MGPTNETQERRERSDLETPEQASPQKGGPWSALMTLSVGAAALGIACGKGSGQADANVSAHYTPVGGMTADSLQLESLISIAREAGLSKLVPVERESTFSNRSIESLQALADSLELPKLTGAQADKVLKLAAQSNIISPEMATGSSDNRIVIAQIIEYCLDNRSAALTEAANRYAMMTESVDLDYYQTNSNGANPYVGLPLASIIDLTDLAREVNPSLRDNGITLERAFRWGDTRAHYYLDTNDDKVRDNLHRLYTLPTAEREFVLITMERGLTSVVEQRGIDLSNDQTLPEEARNQLSGYLDLVINKFVPEFDRRLVFTPEPK